MKKLALIILVLLVSYGNVVAEEYAMKSIGKKQKDQRFNTPLFLLDLQKAKWHTEKR